MIMRTRLIIGLKLCSWYGVWYIIGYRVLNLDLRSKVTGESNKMAMQLLARNLMPHKPEMIARMHTFAGLAGQAGVSAPNGASTGEISPILVGPGLGKDNMDPLSNAPRTHATISLAAETTLRRQGGGMPARLRCVVDQTMSCAAHKETAIVGRSVACASSGLLSPYQPAPCTHPSDTAGQQLQRARDRMHAVFISLG